MMASNQNDRNKRSDGQDGRGRGFAGMDPERRREIAAMGGRASGGNFANDPRRAAEAGRRGGENNGRNNSQGSQGGNNGRS